MTKYALIAAVVAFALLGGMTKLYLDKRDDFAAMKQARAADALAFRTEIAALEAEKVRLQDLIKRRQETINELGKETARILAALDKRTRDFDQWRASLATRTLKKPEVSRRATRSAISSRMRRVCRVSGGDENVCRSPKSLGTSFAAPRRTGSSRANRGDTGKQPGVEPGGSGR